MPTPPPGRWPLLAPHPDSATQKLNSEPLCHSNRKRTAFPCSAAKAPDGAVGKETLWRVVSAVSGVQAPLVKCGMVVFVAASWMETRRPAPLKFTKRKRCGELQLTARVSTNVAARSSPRLGESRLAKPVLSSFFEASGEDEKGRGAVTVATKREQAGLI